MRISLVDDAGDATFSSMRRTHALTVSAFALTLTLGLAGCASDADDSEPSSTTPSSSQSPAAEAPSTEPSAPTQPADTGVAVAAGAVVAGDGYTYTIPVGWSQQDAALAPQADTIAADSAPTGPFASNINVVLTPSGALTADMVEAVAVNELEAGGATSVEVLDRVTVAGSDTAHVTAVLTVGELTYRIHQYYVSSDDQTYVVTFSAAEDLPDEQTTALAESVLATWTWV